MGLSTSLASRYRKTRGIRGEVRCSYVSVFCKLGFTLTDFGAQQTSQLSLSNWGSNTSGWISPMFPLSHLAAHCSFSSQPSASSSGCGQSVRPDQEFLNEGERVDVLPDAFQSFKKKVFYVEKTILHIILELQWDLQANIRSSDAALWLIFLSYFPVS